MKKLFVYLNLMLLLVTQANAQVNSLVDLFGDYKFTADVEFTEAGKAYTDVLSGDCDAVIKKVAGVYDASIIGFAGSQVEQNINDIQTSTNRIKVLNPNNPQLWDGLYLANADGEHPYPVWDEATQTSLTEGYGPLYYTYNPDTKEISIPDFTVVQIESYSSVNTTIIARYKNVKMTLVKGEEIEVSSDLSGDWTFVAGTGAYDTDKTSSIPTTFAVSLTKTNDNNRDYNAKFSIDGFDDFTLPAKFDGVNLSMTYDNTVVYLSETDTIRLNYYYGNVKTGTIDFSYSNDNLLVLSGGFALVSDTTMYKKNADTEELELVDDVVIKQWYTAGTLKKNGEEGSDFSWEGTYTVSAGLVVPAGATQPADWPAEFEFVVTYYDVPDLYMITEFMGYDTYMANQGQGFVLTPAADGKSATVALDGYYNMAVLQSNGDGTFLQVTDGTSKTEPLLLTLNDDGTVKIAPFFIQTLDPSTTVQTPVVFYDQMTANKKTAPVFDWKGDYTLTAGNVVVYDTTIDYPKTFDLTIDYFDGSVYQMDSYYYISHFMGKSIGQTPIMLNIAEDGNSAEMLTGDKCYYIGTNDKGENMYHTLYDMNKTTSPVAMTLNDDGTVTVADFFLRTAVKDSEIDGALYENVTIAKATSTGIDDVEKENNVVEGIYDLSGRRIEVITAPGVYIVNGKKVLVK